MTKAPTPPILDPAGAARLKKWGGDALLLRMLGLFEEQARIRVEDVREGLADGDLDRVRRGAHSLKSSAGNVGAERLRAISSDLEACASAGDREAVSGLAQLLARSYEETLAALGGLRRDDSEEGGG